MNCGVQCYLLLLPRGLLLTSVICLEWRELELVWRRQCVLARAATQTLTPGPGSRSITKLYFNESWGCWEPETILLFRRQANTWPSIDLFSNQLFYLSLYCAVKTNIIWRAKAHQSKLLNQKKQSMAGYPGWKVLSHTTSSQKRIWHALVRLIRQHWVCLIV